METPAAAHVASQFGKKFIFFRSLSDLAGGEDEGNAMGVFFGVAAANAVTTLSAFLEALPAENASTDDVPVPNDHSPGEDTPGLLGVLSFYEPELAAMTAIMNGDEEAIELVYGGRKFYRGKIGNGSFDGGLHQQRRHDHGSYTTVVSGRRTNCRRRHCRWSR